jgi:hypothetical protein
VRYCPVGRPFDFGDPRFFDRRREPRDPGVNRPMIFGRTFISRSRGRDRDGGRVGGRGRGGGGDHGLDGDVADESDRRIIRRVRLRHTRPG